MNINWQKLFLDDHYCYYGKADNGFDVVLDNEPENLRYVVFPYVVGHYEEYINKTYVIPYEKLGNNNRLVEATAMAEKILNKTYEENPRKYKMYKEAPNMQINWKRMVVPGHKLCLLAKGETSVSNLQIYKDSPNKKYKIVIFSKATGKIQTSKSVKAEKGNFDTALAVAHKLAEGIVA